MQLGLKGEWKEEIKVNEHKGSRGRRHSKPRNKHKYTPMIREIFEHSQLRS